MAALIGISYAEFLTITPKILSIYIKAFNEREHNKQKAMAVQAYQISRWVWQKSVDIDKILNTKKEKKVMTDEEMLTQVKSLNKLFGGEVKDNGSKE